MFLPRPASHVRASMLPCVEAPLSESTVLMADAGTQPTGSTGARVCVCVCVMCVRVVPFLPGLPVEPV